MSWTVAELPDLRGRRFLVTGGASGLGFETGRALARRGACVILADRNAEGGLEAQRRIASQTRTEVEFRPLDLANLSSIHRFAEAQNRSPLALDGLINVAGILPPFRRALTADGFELKFGISHLGHFALTGLLLPALLRSAAPRVVSVSSLVQARGRIAFEDLQGERHYEPQKAYNQAKLACLMFALELHERARAARLPLASIAAHPGIARTAIGVQRARETPLGLRDRLENVAFATAMRVFGQEAEQGALPLLYAAAAPAAEGGAYYGPDGLLQFSGGPRRVEPSAAARDGATRERLWAVSEQLTGVDYSRLLRRG